MSVLSASGGGCDRCGSAGCFYRADSFSLWPGFPRCSPDSTADPAVRRDPYGWLYGHLRRDSFLREHGKEAGNSERSPCRRLCGDRGDCVFCPGLRHLDGSGKRGDPPFVPAFCPLPRAQRICGSDLPEGKKGRNAAAGDRPGVGHNRGGHGHNRAAGLCGPDRPEHDRARRESGIRGNRLSPSGSVRHCGGAGDTPLLPAYGSQALRRNDR